MPATAPPCVRASQVARRVGGAQQPPDGPYAALRDEIATAQAQGHFHGAYENALFRYGLAWHTRQFVCAAFAAASGDAVSLVSCGERGWDDQQDVLAFRREA